MVVGIRPFSRCVALSAASIAVVAAVVCFLVYSSVTKNDRADAAAAFAAKFEGHLLQFPTFVGERVRAARGIADALSLQPNAVPSPSEFARVRLWAVYRRNLVPLSYRPACELLSGFGPWTFFITVWLTGWA